MFKALSRSVSIMFAFDFFILMILTAFWCKYFNLQNQTELLTSAFICITGLIVLFLKGYYKVREFNITLWNAYRLFEGVVFAHIPVCIVLFFFIDKIILAKFLCFNILTVWFLLYIYRVCFHFYLFNIKKIKKVLIIGANDRAKVVADVIKNKKALKMEAAGIVKTSEIEKTSEFKEIEIFENEKDIKDIAEQVNADIVIFTKKSSLINVLPSNIKHYFMTDFYEMATGKYYIDCESLADFSYEFIKYPKNIYEIWKRRLDIVCALIILIATLPVTVIAGLIIKLADGKSPFYMQDRVGKDGKIFKAYKLRTMYDNDFVPLKNNQVGYVENEDNDDRIIKGCKFVRKARFDEIPQMINILKGDMSIVGPRAEWAEMADIYKIQIEGYEKRTLIPTAWTGWAQINQGHCVSVNDIKEKLQYDLYYIKHRNIFFDFAILVKAIFLALGGRHQ